MHLETWTNQRKLGADVTADWVPAESVCVCVDR